MNNKLSSLVSFTKKQFSTKVRQLTFMGLSLTLLNQSSLAAEQEWWFDVEVILFERVLAENEVSEKFVQSGLDPATQNTLDILTPHLSPDISYLLAGLPYCRESKRQEVEKGRAEDFAFAQMQWSHELLSKVDEPVQIALEELSQQQTDNFEYQVVSTDIFDKQQNTDTNLTEDVPLKTADISEIDYIEWQLPRALPCAYAEQIDPSLALPSSHNSRANQALISRVPIKMNGIEWQTKRSAFLLPQESLRMDKLYQSIQSKKGINPILHVAWRQEVVFGREASQAIRLFAGKNYGEQYQLNGQRRIEDTDELFLRLGEPKDYVPEDEQFTVPDSVVPQQENSPYNSSIDLFSAIDAALLDDTPVTPTAHVDGLDNSSKDVTDNPSRPADLWQIDGEIAIYLRNIGRVPYLHIDSNLDYRQTIFEPQSPLVAEQQAGVFSGETNDPANFLQSVNFDQLRRVISKQVHYFDHPLFGMVITINRYQWPKVEEPSKE